MLISVVLTTSCKKEFVDIRNGNRIIFNTETPQTKAAGYTQEGANAYLSMGVYSINTGSNDWAVNQSYSILMNKEEVTRENGSSAWIMSNIKSWPYNEKLTFFAYAPHTATGLTVSHNDPSNSGKIEGRPTVDYIVSATHSEQIDLLVSAVQYNKTESTTPIVSLPFVHALTKITFSARAGKPISVGNELYVTEVKISNVLSQGAIDMDANATWTLGATKQTYTLTNAVGGGLLDTPTIYTELKTINTADGNFFLIPQSIPDDAKLEVTYRLDIEGVAGTPQTFTMNLKDILDEWTMGEAIRFIFTIPNPATPDEFEVSYKHIAWDDASLDVEIDTDPFLDVTNIVATAYDAAVTRVYFYTNISTDKVYIEPEGRVSTSTGASFAVAGEFYAIAKGDANGTMNFHYSDTGSDAGKGYIDIVNIKTSSAGERPNQGKYPLIIKLRAGKLVREITVQPSVSVEAAKQITNLYVGTYHRWNETGERIVTWHLPETQKWIATIDNTIGDFYHLAIDRMASADFANNILFSNAPRNSEGSMVSDETTTVSGIGRVYFRVGWKTPTINTVNRYARVRVEYLSSGGVVTNTHYIYCRQGEKSEKIAIAESRFAVYNVNGYGEMTQYPSQIGFFYQWNRIKPWNPIGIEAPPGYPNTYETNYALERNICPDRYGYPSQDDIDNMKLAVDYGVNQWGFYADGFFDRRPVSPSNSVNPYTLDVASAGMLFYNPLSARAIFVPTGGYRDGVGKLIDAGTVGGYWTKENSTLTDNAEGMLVFFGMGASDIKSYIKLRAYNVRCVELDSWLVSFDANGGDNPPRAITVVKGQSAILPVQPDMYWKDNYIFDKWCVAKNGTGTKYAAGTTYTPTSDITFYAQWIVDPYTKVNLKNYISVSHQTNLLLTAGATHKGWVLGANNGFFTTLAATKAERAYPNLQFTDIRDADSWSNAYSICKSLTDKGVVEGTWRLPRATELAWFSQYDQPNNASYPLLYGLGIIEAGVNNYFWTATENSLINAWSFNAYEYKISLKTASLKYRCVRELPVD